MTRRVSFKRSLKYAAVAAAAGVILLELVLRLGLGAGDPVLVQADPEIGYLFKAGQTVHRLGNTVQINAHHQRSGPVAATPASGTTRVMMVGDSVTFGGARADQSETLPALLERQLGAAGGGRYQLLNASADSWGVGNLTAYLARFGAFASGLIILQIGSHDLVQLKSDSSKVGVHPSFPTERPFTALGELFTRTLLPRLKKAVGAREPPPWVPAVMEQRFTRNMAYLRQAVQIARQAGARVLVLHTPDRAEVVPGAGGRHDRRHEPFRERFLEVCQGLGVPVVNLPRAWRGGDQAASWFRDGVHLTPAGNVAAARAAAAAVRRLLER